MNWVDLDVTTPLRAGWYAAITRWRTISGRIPTACWWTGTKWGNPDPSRIVCFYPQPFDSAHDAASAAFTLEDATIFALATVSRKELAAAAG